jgi:hypothetical protein
VRLDKLVWVEIDPDTRYVVRIFKSQKQMVLQMPYAECGTTQQMLYKVAVWDVRHQCWLRSKGECELCGDTVTEQSGQMHERQHRGKGGEISVANSVFVCAKTHKREHRDREPRWSRHDSRSEAA